MDQERYTLTKILSLNTKTILMFTNICAWLLNRGIRISPEDHTIFREYTRESKIAKHTLILQQGKPADRLFFLNSGIVRLFKIHNGTDLTVDFISGREFVSTAIYVQNQLPSPYGLETLTEINTLEWGRNDLLLFEESTTSCDKIKAAMLDRLLNWTQERETDIMTLSPEERYVKLMDLQPDIIRSVPLRYIASYLGIHNDSLSRIRKKLSEKS